MEKFHFQCHKLHSSVTVISRPRKTLFVTTALEFSLIWNDLNNFVLSVTF